MENMLEAEPLSLTLGHLSTLQRMTFQVMVTPKHEQLRNFALCGHATTDLSLSASKKKKKLVIQPTFKDTHKSLN